MTDRDLRIARTTRESLSLSKPVFVTTGNLQSLYNDANGVSFAYNKMIKERGGADSSYLSAGKLHATGILHLLYQTVLDTYLKENNPDMFTRIMPVISSQESLKNVLAFYDREFPSPLLKQKLAGETYYNLEVLRAFFIHQVLINNPALVNAAGPLVEPEGLVFPKESSALQSLIGSYTKTIDGKIGHSSEDDIFDFLTKPARLYPNSLTEQIEYILREWADMLSEDLRLLLSVFSAKGHENSSASALSLSDEECATSPVIRTSSFFCLTAFSAVVPIEPVAPSMSSVLISSDCHPETVQECNVDRSRNDK